MGCLNLMASEAHNHPGMPQLYYYGSEHRSAYYEVARARLAVAIGDKYLSRTLKVPTRPDPVPVPEVDKPPKLQAVTSGKLKLLCARLKHRRRAVSAIKSQSTDQQANINPIHEPWL